MAPVRAYFDTWKTSTVQSDASKKGLGAVLFQDGKPVVYASRSLTETEQRYSNRERETESCWVLSLPLKDFITTCMAIQWLFVHWKPEGEGERHSQCTFQSFTSASTWKQGRQRRHPCIYVYWRNPCRYRKYSRLSTYNCRWHDIWSIDASCHKWMAQWKLVDEKW